jgi:hypothetical protein
VTPAPPTTFVRRFTANTTKLGTDPFHDRFERVQKLKLQVENRKLEPAGRFLSAEQWLDALDTLCEQYNATEQQGKLLAGMSPDQAWHHLANAADPQIKFDASCRYLLAHHRRLSRVTKNGIILKFGKNSFAYRNEQTGRLIGQDILAWFNPEAPEVISVTDLDRQNPFAVPLSPEIPAIDATPEQMRSAVEPIAAHQSHARAYYRTLKNKFERPFRANLVAPQITELGQTFDRQQTAVQEQTRAAASLERRADKLGVNVSRSDPRREEIIDAVEGLEALGIDLHKKDT